MDDAYIGSGRPRSAADEAALARFNNIIAIPLVLSAVLPLVLLPRGPHSVIAAIVNIAAWFVFVIDFVVHERRLNHYLNTWLGKFDPLRRDPDCAVVPPPRCGSVEVRSRDPAGKGRTIGHGREWRVPARHLD